MKFIELHNVGYGECIVFEGDKNEIFMIDCGSMNINMKNTGSTFKNYVINFIMPRYSNVNEKSFLLTHFHRDHMCGFKYILKKQKNFFDKIYLPYPPLSQDNRALLLEMAIYAFVFLKRQQACVSMSTSAIFIFNFLRENSMNSKIFPLKRGDVFDFSGVTYEVLSPAAKNFNFSIDFYNIINSLNSMLEKSTCKTIINELFLLKNSFCWEYINCFDLLKKYDNILNINVTQSIEKLNSYILMLSDLSNKVKQLDIYSDIVDFLNNQAVNLDYNKAQNSSSIVFQNKKYLSTSYGNIIMTGDVTCEILNALENDLFEFYNVIKIPHHGTNSYKSHILNNINSNHILISNGEYHAGGNIVSDYAENMAIKHCTNSAVCNYFKKNNSCCNRLIFCNSLSKGGEMSSHCNKKFNSFGMNKCHIYVIGLDSDKGCFCDK